MPSVRRPAFTLIELLVVVSIIALLISILLPAISSAKASAWRLRCTNNQRQLMSATLMYVSDFKDRPPMPNWQAQDKFPGYNGWLYSSYIPTAKFKEEDRETGTIWRYLLQTSIYRCPRHEPPIEKSAQLTSYLMNGAVAGYGRVSPQKKWAERWAFQIPRFRPDALIFWEADEPTWNDGSSYPNEGLTRRHGNGATVVGFDGHTEWMTHPQYRAELDRPTKSKLWCAPDTGNGR